MNAKFLVTAAVVGGVALWLWGAVTHTLLPQVLPQPLREFKNERAMAEAVRANTAGNGVYFARQGVMAAVSFRPDFGDKTKDLTPNLITQLVTDMIGAVLLGIAVLRLRKDSVACIAGWLAVAGLAAFALKMLPYWNWYGFSVGFLGMEALDLVGKFFLGGLLLGALAKKMITA